MKKFIIISVIFIFTIGCKTFNNYSGEITLKSGQKVVVVEGTELDFSDKEIKLENKKMKMKQEIKHKEVKAVNLINERNN